MNVAINGPEILGYLFGNTSLPITETMRNSWIIMAFILFLCIFLTRRMEKIPKGKQAFAEKAVLMIDGLVDSTMGEGCRAFSPYIMTLMMSSLFGSLASLFWMRSTTADARTAASHGMDIRMVQRSCDTLDSVAPPEVTIWSSVPSMSAKSRASPQMRPVETTT